MSHDNSNRAGDLMGAELDEQPDRWIDLIEQGRPSLSEAANLLRSIPDAPIVFVARGSSDHAAIYGQHLAQLGLRRPAFLSSPSIASLGKVNTIPSNAIVVAVSQSGESPDLLATIAMARDGGCPVIALTNAPSSAMSRLSDISVDLQAGTERSVAATKTYTAELLAIAAITWLAQGRGTELCDRTHALAEIVRVGMTAFRPQAAEIGRNLANASKLMVIGRLLSTATAKEAALKFMETSQVAASGWSAADAKHGPIGQITPGTPVFLAGTRGMGASSVLEFGRDAEALGATIFAPDVARDHDLGDLEPISGIVPFQMIARELALLKLLDPDRPIGLSKVTLTL